MTLYLKYRPKDLSELDITSVRESLEKIVKSKNIPHAFLFSGPKGTGKTSAARILAKVINCETRRKNSFTPCSKCGQCKSIANGSNLDVMELDAASHRGIDDMRSLRDAVKLSPGSALKKVYIIDEAHMLTTEASNALLKTLEEPPDHVIFILATTNPEKLIETIRSRTTNIKFSKATDKEIVRSLERVVKGERIKGSADGLELIAKASDGSFRDAIKTLEQLVSEGFSLKVEDVEDFLKTSTGSLDELLGYLSKKDLKGSLLVVEGVVRDGGSVEVLTKNLLEKLRSALLAEVGVGEEKIEGFGKKDLFELIQILFHSRESFKNSLIESLPLEMAVVKWCDNFAEDFEEEEEEIEEEEKVIKKKENVFKKKASKPVMNFKKGKNIGEKSWGKILEKIKPINSTIEALLRASKPLGFDGKNLSVGVYYKFHKERLEDIRYRKILESIASDILGGVVKITCVVTNQPKKIKKIKEKIPEIVLTEGKDGDILKAAEEIFSN